MRREWIARFLVVVLTAAALAVPAWGGWQGGDWITLRARMPEDGGWEPANLSVRTGEPLRLRLTSEDVVHSIAIGQSDRPPVDIVPGEVTELELIFDQPGTYTYYCTRWCGANHWRMRGTISVVGNETEQDVTPESPLYLRLGSDLDAPRELPDLELTSQPSAKNGAALGDVILTGYLSQDAQRTHSPYEVWEDLRASASTAVLTDDQVWDLVALTWQRNTDPAALDEGQTLYARDCAACHGVDGQGDGVFAVEQTNHDQGHLDEALEGHSQEAPTDFRDYGRMLSASPALLQGKILRGGMGTGMPSWGAIYTEAQTWALVDYLWSFVFSYHFGSEDG